MIAEESTAWPAVSRPTYLGGLGFSMKWNMGWMHDTLAYMEKDPIYRHYHHDLLTFGLLYAFTENFVLPFSHDEVVHGKKSMLDKMPGDDWQKFASLRLLYTFMFTYPGKKLLFRAASSARARSGTSTTALDWELLERPPAPGRAASSSPTSTGSTATSPALHEVDFDGRGVRMDRLPRQLPVGAELHPQGPRRRGDGRRPCSTSPRCRAPTTASASPWPGFYREAINSDAEFYGGSNVGNQGGVRSEPVSWMGRPHSIPIALPPLGGLILVHEPLPEPTPATKAQGKVAATTAADPSEPEPAVAPVDTFPTGLAT